MSKKVLILGASGMAGHKIYTYLKEQNKYKIVTVCHKNKICNDSCILDIYNTTALAEIIKSEMPEFIINCVGILISGSKNNPANAIYVNAYFPHKLSEILHSVKPGSQVIHISTDCVFSGREGNYKDCDVKNALDTYGMTKNLGELVNDSDITLRTSIIGPELKMSGEGLLHWFLCHRNDRFLNGFEKTIWGGITTLELARVIDFCLSSEIRFSGLFQLSNNQSISKYDLLCLFKKYFGGKAVINKTDGVVSNKSIVATANFEGNKLLKNKSYNDMVKCMFDFMVSHKEMYSQYFS